MITSINAANILKNKKKRLKEPNKRLPSTLSRRSRGPKRISRGGDNGKRV